MHVGDGTERPDSQQMLLADRIKKMMPGTLRRAGT
jgi:hypothetical protein